MRLKITRWVIKRSSQIAGEATGDKRIFNFGFSIYLQIANPFDFKDY